MRFSQSPECGCTDKLRTFKECRSQTPALKITKWRHTSTRLCTNHVVGGGAFLVVPEPGCVVVAVPVAVAVVVAVVSMQLSLSMKLASVGVVSS